MTGDPRFDVYEWPGGREAMLRFGPDTGPVVVVALPLFEEANRTRAFVVAILRSLAARGVGGVLPDMPGQGESLVALETVSLADMQTAFAAAVSQTGRDRRGRYIIGIRSGVLMHKNIRARRREPGLDPRLRGDTMDLVAAVGDGGQHDGSWRLAPQDGPALLRELSRMKQAEHGPGQSGDASVPTLIAGNMVSPAMLSALAASDLIDGADLQRRTVRLSTDPAPADRKLDGPPLWRRSEPGTDQALSQMLADDIADWISACER